ncbi:MAG: hypothetical protein DRP55_04920 [Spirochaetes bacterium]|nr:MAG: hypothetical protein DRP55_04920 [Spirochaetota bacterium]
MNKKDNLIVAEVDNEGMVIDVKRGKSFYLNETALIIFKMLREGKGDDQIKEYIMNTYEVSEDILIEDIKRIKRECISKKLI